MKKPEKKEPEMRQEIIGVYHYNMGSVEIVAREGRGGEGWYVPEAGKNKVPRLKIGFDVCWEDSLAVIIHEVWEFLLAVSNYRFERSDDIGRDHAQYFFIFNHPQFTDLCCKSAMILVDAIPDLQRAHKKWHQKTTKKKTKSKKTGKKNGK